MGLKEVMAGVAGKVREASTVVEPPLAIDPAKLVLVPVGPHRLQGELVGALEDGDVVPTGGRVILLVDVHDRIADDVTGVR